MFLYNPGFVQAVLACNWLPAEEIARVIGPKEDASQLLRVLLEGRQVPRHQVVRLWADGFQCAWIDLTATLFQKQVVELLPQSMARQYNTILIYSMGRESAAQIGKPSEKGRSAPGIDALLATHVVTAAMANPLDMVARQEIEALIQRPISPVCALQDEIQEAIDLQYQSAESLAGWEKAGVDLILNAPDGRLETSDLERLAGSQAAVELVRSILILALKEEASDIHIEPSETETRLRFRLDGVLVKRLCFSKEIHVMVCSRIKVMCNLDIIERRLPQDGHLHLALSRRGVDFRVSLFPTVCGEKIVLRILGSLKRKEIPSLESLIFSKLIYDQVRQVMASPNGLFLITGPTGSGKSTTLFAALQSINQPGINIMTVEDPVEYRLPGLNQAQVNPAIGLTFGAALRAFMRQDPDVILVGEIRDLETAKIAAEAALTGHLVLATLHTNDAVQAVTRLVEMGVPPFLVGPTLMAIIAQRLVRKICEQCKVHYFLTQEEMDRLFVWDGVSIIPFFRGEGCEACRGTGYRGRIAIHEMIQVDEQMRALVTSGAHIQEIYEAARRGGYQPLYHDGIKKAIRGLTSLDEVKRVSHWT